MKSTIFRAALGIVGMLLMGSAMAQTPRMHTMIVSDVSPWADWGRYELNVQMDSSIVHSLLATNVPDAQLEIHHYQIFEDALGHPEKLKEFIRGVSPRPADTVVFYFSGHGGHDDRGHYLALAGGRLYRDEVRELLAEKGCRLNVIITDCCDQRSDGQAFGAPAMDMEPPRQVTPLFQSLFFRPRGTVDINSSSPNEAAFFTPFGNNGDGPAGSLFTSQVERFVYRYKQQSTNWEHFLRSVSLNVHLAFRAAYPNGAVSGKGGKFQTDQNVYAHEYPGMPEKQGPRTGFTIREHSPQGAMITQVRAGYPASNVYDLAAQQYRSLQPGEVVVAANNQPTRTVSELLAVIQESPQVMRLTIRSSRRGERDVLIRLRY